MSELDDFALATVTPQLRPGEVILSIGWMAPHMSKWRDQQERYFAVGTNQRLVVIQTGKGLMWGGPKAESLGATVYELAPLSGAATRNFGAMTTNLVLEQPGGRVAWAIPSPSIVGAKCVDGHPDFVASYITWLCRHVAAGSLRTAEGQAAAAFEWQDRAGLKAANDRYLIQQGSTTTKATRFVKWPIYLGLMFLFLIAYGFKMKDDAATKIHYTERHMDFSRQVASEGEVEWDLEDALAADRAIIAAAKSKQTQGTLVMAVGPIGLLGFSILAFVLTAKKRKRARAAAAG